MQYIGREVYPELDSGSLRGGTTHNDKTVILL